MVTGTLQGRAVLSSQQVGQGPGPQDEAGPGWHSVPESSRRMPTHITCLRLVLSTFKNKVPGCAPATPSLTAAGAQVLGRRVDTCGAPRLRLRGVLRAGPRAVMNAPWSSASF